MNSTRTTIRAGLYAVAIGGLLVGAAHQASAATIDFDSIATPNCGTATPDPIPAGFGGFTWDATLGVLCDADYAGYGNSTGAPSAPNAIYNQFATDTVLVTRGTPFQFDGALFSGWTLSDLVDIAGGVTAASVTVNGFLGGTGGVLVGTRTIALAGLDGSAGLGYLALAGIAGAVDTLQIVTPANFWLMDNFQYEELSKPPVPEPATFALLAFGLVGVVGLRRRRPATATSSTTVTPAQGRSR